MAMDTLSYDLAAGPICKQCGDIIFKNEDELCSLCEIENEEEV